MLETTLWMLVAQLPTPNSASTSASTQAFSTARWDKFCEENKEPVRCVPWCVIFRWMLRVITCLKYCITTPLRTSAEQWWSRCSRAMERRWIWTGMRWRIRTLRRMPRRTKLYTLILLFVIAILTRIEDWMRVSRWKWITKFFFVSLSIVERGGDAASPPVLLFSFPS